MQQWQHSIFGQRLCGPSGIGELMDDLGEAIAAGGDKIRMLGGGQPAHIPELDTIWRNRVVQLTDSPKELAHVLGNYEPPSGNMEFRDSLATLFRNQFGWDVSAENVGVTFGAQSAFFFLFNLLAGDFDDGSRKKILLPLLPEYIGYANQSVGDQFFSAAKPKIEAVGDHQFKYAVDFEKLTISDDIAAMCVSRPTNPSGNVLTDDEIKRLSDLAKQHDIPLIVDNAYGAPFPNAIFTGATPSWDTNTILTFSLSKLGLPGTRTGIVVADRTIIRALSAATSIVGLSNTNIGQAIVKPMIDDGKILEISKDIIQPFYRKKSEQAQEFIAESFDRSIPYRVHVSEGAFFVWLWLEGLPIKSSELYQRLKSKGVLVVPGNYFFFGDDDNEWKHRYECLRVTFTQPENTVREAMQIIGQEVANIYGKTKHD